MVMDEGVLARERESGWAHTTLLKDLAMVVELAKSVIESMKRGLGDGVQTCYVTELQKCCDGLDDVHRDKTFKGSDEDLHKRF